MALLDKEVRRFIDCIPKMVATPVPTNSKFTRPIDALFENPTLIDRNKVRPFLTDMSERINGVRLD